MGAGMFAPFRRWSFVVAVTLVASVAHADLASDEAILEGRLMAPCCNVQTLDVHASPLADELRAEVHRRLLAGEAPAVIEKDLISRFGETMRAAPHGRDTRTDFAFGVAAIALAAAVGAVAYLRRKPLAPTPSRPQRAGKGTVRARTPANLLATATPQTASPLQEGISDLRLDEELENFEE